MRLAILSSHPIQYYAPLFQAIARQMQVTVFFAHKASPEQQSAAGFETAFDWDIDLVDGYSHEFLPNVARDPGVHHFFGCDTPAIANRLSTNRYDALLVTGWHLKSYLQGILAGKRYRVPVMVRGDSHLATPRGLTKRMAKALAYPPLLRLFDAALYVGERNRAYYERYGYPAERLFRSPHCVDTERFGKAATDETRAALRARLGIRSEEKAVLFAGKLLDIKRPLDVVEAAAVARGRGLPLHVIIAGSGPLASELRSRASARNVPLHLLGFQNQTQMPAIYAAADVLALPSDQETWGLVCNEALSCGTPIVVSDAVGCAPDLAADGVIGQTFPLGDIQALAVAIAKSLHAPPPIAAVRQLSERHSLSAAVAGVMTAMESLRVEQAQPA